MSVEYCEIRNLYYDTDFVETCSGCDCEKLEE